MKRDQRIQRRLALVGLLSLGCVEVQERALEVGFGAADQGAWVMDAGRVRPAQDGELPGDPPPACEGLQAAPEVGLGCLNDSQCGQHARCLRLTGATTSTCYQRCVPDLCVAVCATAEDCTPLLAQDGQPYLEDGVAAGYCATARSCLEIMTCVYACRDAACQAGCYAGAGRAAIDDASSLITCLNDNGARCGDNACFAAACADSWHCMPGVEAPQPDAGIIEPRLDAGIIEPGPDAAPPPISAVDCQPAWRCQLGCEGAEACQGACLNGAAAGVATRLDDLNACFEGAASWRHAAEACPEAWGQCRMPPVGHGDCASAYMCLIPCEDVVCVEGCRLAARPEAVEQLDDLGACFQRNGVETIEAAMARCGVEWTSCGLEEVRLSGTNCRDTWYCVIECGEDANCQRGCINASTSQAEAEVGAVFDCAQSIGAQTWNEVGNQCVEWTECGLNRPTNQGCADLFMQIFGGSCSTSRCQLDASVNTTLNGMLQFDALYNCMMQAFPNGGQLDSQQIANACPAQWSACGL
ncbi:hypothetical protein KKF91_11725 [Myxococcota bacterium]|nr:hypothetical protein [Myxococcota bacterium]MBU1431198.1 hypothetical protein [Myxococcota bacterium]MBU1896481.1 hypothetical protein [Myxococcota bacterium]